MALRFAEPVGLGIVVDGRQHTEGTHRRQIQDPEVRRTREHAERVITAQGVAVQAGGTGPLRPHPYHPPRASRLEDALHQDRDDDHHHRQQRGHPTGAQVARGDQAEQRTTDRRHHPLPEGEGEDVCVRDAVVGVGDVIPLGVEADRPPRPTTRSRRRRDDHGARQGQGALPLAGRRRACGRGEAVRAAHHPGHHADPEHTDTRGDDQAEPHGTEVPSALVREEELLREPQRASARPTQNNRLFK